MRLYIPGFDLKGTADSGQCFRLLPEGAGSWGLIAHGEYLKIQDLGEGWFDFACTRDAYESVWKTYFDLERDYQQIHALIHPGDGYLYDAADYARGIRILKQEPFETLISFIISQRKNLPAIRHCVRQLSLSYGERIEEGIHAFPTPVALAKASLDGCWPAPLATVPSTSGKRRRWWRRERLISMPCTTCLMKSCKQP